MLIAVLCCSELYIYSRQNSFLYWRVWNGDIYLNMFFDLKIEIVPHTAICWIELWATSYEVLFKSFSWYKFSEIYNTDLLWINVVPLTKDDSCPCELYPFLSNMCLSGLLFFIITEWWRRDLYLVEINLYTAWQIIRYFHTDVLMGKIKT